MGLCVRYSIRGSLEDALGIISKMRIGYNSIPGELTKKLLLCSRHIAEALPRKYERFSILLNEAISELFSTNPPGRINAYAYGRLTRTLEVLDVILPHNSGKKVFVSHSSKDKTIVDAFVDKVFRLGIGISPEEIFCTSLEDLRIKNGEDIRHHIHENILGCEYAFLLISDNYFKSAICQNELGAVWVSDAKVKIYTFPDVKIPESLGWLCEPKVAERLNDEHALDCLFEEMKADFSLSTSLATFSKQRAKFLDLFNKKKKSLFAR